MQSSVPSFSSIPVVPQVPILSASPSEEKSLIDRGRDDGKNWTWPEADKGKWQVVAGGCQKFYKHWRGGSNESEFHRSEFPYPLSLGTDGSDGQFLPIPIPTKPGSPILVTESYEKMFHHLLLLREGDSGDSKGAVIIGQPGIGKTTFLIYLLARLLSLDQPSLVCDNQLGYLFYQGLVYSRPAYDAFFNLPYRQPDLPGSEEYFPVWAMIDNDTAKTEPPISPRLNLWAIQASSPQPYRYQSWKKQNGAAGLGLPPWDEDELVDGLPFARTYDKFRSGLERCLRTSEAPTDVSLNAALEVIRAAGQRKRVAAELGMYDDVNTSTRTRRKEYTDDREGQIQAAIDEVFEILVRNATEEVGFAPRDVYRFIFFNDLAKESHESKARGLTYAQLQAILHAFNSGGELDETSHLIVAMRPCELGVHSTKWEIGFKSNRIAKIVATTMRLTECKRLQETYDFLHRIPSTSAMAGRFFEAFAHRMFTTSWKGPELSPQPTLMTRDDTDSLTYSTGRPLPLPSYPPIPPPIRPSARDAVDVDLPNDLSPVTLREDRYYIPIAPNNPLFDSFTVDHYPDRGTVILSIFQMTTSKKHGGSGKGYAYIQEIMDHISRLLANIGSSDTVKTAYFLVCPSGKSENHWTMPPGWQTKITTRNPDPEKNKHFGNVYCIRFPGFDCIGDDQSQA